MVTLHVVVIVKLRPYAASQHQTDWDLRVVLAKRPIGAAYLVMLENREYLVGLVGEARKAPDLTRGRLCRLDDELAVLMRPLILK